MNPENAPRSRIRSFIRRQGRLTPGQQLALDNHWQRYGLDPKAPFNHEQAFGRQAPLIVEIGFGNGESLAAMAAANPETDYIGIEVHTPGVGHLMMMLDQQGISNVRIYSHDAIEVIENCLPDNFLAGLHLYFPDPWPKKKHHKRRIVRTSFIELLGKKLQSGGYFHAATDWQHYAEWMLDLLTSTNILKNTSPTQDYCDRPEHRPLTKFEQRGLKLGHGVWDLIFTKP
jgi:tRNA (guanine-N7-)-methyltransferase